MKIAYCYPNKILGNRLSLLFGSEIQFSPTTHISDLMNDLFDQFGEDNVLPKLPTFFRTKDISPPSDLQTVDDWMLWLSDYFIPSEPSLLSPGAMSNAPDRLDGFHSFNLCCRKNADKGRNDNNMRSYSTDRRVFEYWSEGDWIAADRLMGIINSQFRDHPCADGGDGPGTADHIGPISLGFMHYPKFRLLSRAANSAKNNRMTLWDVNYLKHLESKGENIVSWYARPLWDLRKGSVNTEEHALRLSKMMRDNQRAAMQVLCRLFDAKSFSFLAALLELEHANYKISFINLRLDDHVTAFDQIKKEPRNTKYSNEQKSRRIRIAFNSLQGYHSKSNRHLFTIESAAMDDAIHNVTQLLSDRNGALQKLDNHLYTVLFSENATNIDQRLRDLAPSLPAKATPIFIECKQLLTVGFNDIAQSISGLWDTDRYVRANFDFES
eukprot:TRINITY_DN13529_c0_g2_i1.p1 TRINITY_DN13529_c0_g2~~TRINITY_DN13529_c0_g2_i1.p1  ORF type:complete len:439 (-),score=-76.94 TRINITY_DN13529_c0_g2_i1:1255-2571(-)